MFELTLKKSFPAHDDSTAAGFCLDIHLTSDQHRVVLTGPSGAGKTTLIKLIAGLLSPDCGKICLRERVLFDSSSTPVLNLAPAARRLGYVSQHYGLFPHLTVQQNIAFGLTTGWRNPPRHPCPPAVGHWLEALALTPLAQAYPNQLSGGQQQRVALARALVIQPDALLLDEPFAALDHDLRAQARAELDRLQRQLALPLLLISHDPDDLAQFGEAVYRLQQGRLHAG
nr:ATP-binding cassette domain-containing protein [Parvibium lacunae]